MASAAASFVDSTGDSLVETRVIEIEIIQLRFVSTVKSLSSLSDFCRKRENLIDSAADATLTSRY